MQKRPVWPTIAYANLAALFVCLVAAVSLHALLPSKKSKKATNKKLNGNKLKFRFTNSKWCTKTNSECAFDEECTSEGCRKMEFFTDSQKMPKHFKNRRVFETDMKTMQNWVAHARPNTKFPIKNV